MPSADFWGFPEASSGTAVVMSSVTVPICWAPSSPALAVAVSTICLAASNFALPAQEGSTVEGVGRTALEYCVTFFVSGS